MFFKLFIINMMNNKTRIMVDKIHIRTNVSNRSIYYLTCLSLLNFNFFKTTDHFLVVFYDTRLVTNENDSKSSYYLSMPDIDFSFSDIMAIIGFFSSE